MELIDIVYNVLFLVALFLTGFFTLGFILSRSNQKEFERRVDQIRFYNHREATRNISEYRTGSIENLHLVNNDDINRDYQIERTFYIPHRDHTASGQYYYN